MSKDWEGMTCGAFLGLVIGAIVGFVVVVGVSRYAVGYDISDITKLREYCELPLTRHEHCAMAFIPIKEG